MFAPVYSASDYLGLFLRLLPRGRVWNRGLDSVQAETLGPLMPTWERQHGRDNQLLVEGFPSSTTELIGEWEDTLGLPDPCTGPLDTLQQRRAAIVAKLTSIGDPTIPNIETYLGSLGFIVEIDNGPGPFEFTVYAGDNSSVWFRASQSAAGERLHTWGNTMLECGVEYIKPAHTTGSIVYLLPASWDNELSIWDNGTSTWDVGARPPT